MLRFDIHKYTHGTVAYDLHTDIISGKALFEITMKMPVINDIALTST